MSAIAIVGMACRFAGAPDLPAYWQLLLDGRSAFGPVPPDRWDAAAFTSASARDMDRATAPAGAFVDDVRTFPALALGIPPRRVEVMDPQQRFALEAALQAIEDAGLAPADLPRQTGVYVGITGHEYRLLVGSRIMATMMASGQLGAAPDDPGVLAEAVENVVPPRPFSAPGVLGNMSASAIAQELDLTGPAYTIDAACASSMIAVADAVEQLRTGKIDAALAGGVYLQLTPLHHVAFTRIGAMSTSGACRPFDHRADGFVQGDGVGMVLLKRLADAERDGDRIYAVLEGVAVNSDGRGDGPMAPRAEGQSAVIRAAWRDAGRDPARATHVETHGTGTVVGDGVELDGIRASIGGGVRVALGSSKGNVGHTMSAAGVAGLIKAALSIHHRTLPPLAGFERPKAELPLHDTAWWMPTAPVPWDDPERLTGVSSFGFGGTNAHAVLRAGPQAAPVEDQPELVLLSAPTPEALRDLARRTAAAIRHDAHATVAGVARALAHRRRQSARAGIVAASLDELLTALDALAAGEALPAGAHAGDADDAPRIAFLFPGQGAQRVGMLRDVARRFPIVRHVLERLEEALDGELAVPLTELLWPGDDVSPDEAHARLTATEHCQPAMLAVGVALDALLSQLGVRPAVVTGHSLGEFAAAAVAGVLSPEDAARFVARRGRSMAALPGDHGAMAAIMADRATTEGLLVPGAVIANENHPRQHVVSGTTEAVDAVVRRAEAADVVAKRLVVSHAFHSPVLADLDAAALLEGVRFADPALPVASGIADRPYADADDARGVFLRHATSPVRFGAALEQCVAEGADLFLQVGAGGPLASFARGGAGRTSRGVLTLASMEDADGGRSLLDTLAQLWVRGADLDVAPITAPAPLATLPPTVLPREPYWAVKDVRQRPLKLEGARPRAPRAEAAPLPPAPVEEVVDAAAAPHASRADDDVLDGVMEVVAAVSAYPKAALKASVRLLEDLGFDSLMVGDLATGLAKRFPGVDGIPQELLLGSPTLADLATFVREGAQGAEPDDDDAPLLRFAPTWTPAPLPALPGRALPTGWWVTGADPDDVARAAAALTAAGVEVRAGGPDEVARAEGVGVLVWIGPTSPPRTVADALDDGAWPDQAADLLPVIAGLAARGQRPDVVALSRDDDPWAAGLAGALRSLAREWPDAVVKHVRADDLTAAVSALPDELTSADRSVDVRWSAGARQVLGLTRQPDAPTLPQPGADDTVLVTGGTRGLGLALGLRLASLGARVLLVGRRAPAEEDGARIAAFPNVAVREADVLDRAALAAAVAGEAITAVVHAAGALADGAVEAVDPAAGALARRVKVEGWLNALAAAGPTLRRATGIGSWAGRLGNRHQAHYAAANALLAELSRHAPDGVHACVGEYGPFTGSAMAETIPAPVRRVMRSEGVDFVGPEAGLTALVGDLCHAPGPVVHGRRLPDTTRRTRVEVALSVADDPFLLDHAIEGTPVLPLAAVADLLAWTAGRAAPYELVDLELFAGVTVSEPVRLVASCDGQRAELRGADGRLHDRAVIRPLTAPPDVPAPLTGGEPPTVSLEAFYGGITFHGPALQGIRSIDGVSDEAVRGTVVAGRPADWTPGTSREAWSIDPLALDSALQLAAYAAWVRFRRAATPVRIGRLVVLGALEPGRAYVAEARDLEVRDDAFHATVILRDADGRPLLLAEGVVAEIRELAGDGEDAWAPDPDLTDPSRWPEVQDLTLRLDGLEAMGLDDPYFHVHEGTARDTTRVDGRELVNFSSYNYLGLSGDPRVLARVHEAVERYGTSVSASRVASGERPFHAELERGLAEAQGAEAALLFTAGHATNVTTVGHLVGPEDLVLHDAYIHDSVLQGIKLSGAKRRWFRHEDPDHLEQQLRALRKGHRRCLIVVEGVYSMDGDICDLPRYVELKRRYGALLMVDEAHSFGVIGATGRGVGEHWGVPGREVDLWMGTLSKSLASCGGWIAGSKALIRYLRYTAPGFVYSAGLTPANGVAALAALDLMLQEPERVRGLQANAAVFHEACVRHGLDTGPALGGSGVVPVITGNSMHALVLSQRLVRGGVNVQPIVYPAVADDAARLRFFLSSTHTERQLRETAATVAATLEGVRQEYPLP